MKKPEIAKQWARRSGLSRAEAADRLDGAVRHILLQLRTAREAPLPGFGRLVVGPDGKVSFEPGGSGRHG